MIKLTISLIFVLHSCALWSKTENTLVFSFSTDIEPYSYEEKSRLLGVDIKLVEEIFSNSPYQIEFRQTSYPRVLHDLITGRTDLGVVFTAFNISKASYPDTVELSDLPISTSSIIAHHHSYVELSRFPLKDLNDYHIGYIRIFPELDYDLSTQFKHRTAFNSQKSLYRAWLANRIDIAIGEKLVSQSTLEKLTSNRDSFEFVVLGELHTYMSFSKVKLGKKLEDVKSLVEENLRSRTK